MVSASHRIGDNDKTTKENIQAILLKFYLLIYFSVNPLQWLVLTIAKGDPCKLQKH
jgi:hypothetical protein